MTIDLLYIEASPRKERSHSIAVAREFLRAARASRAELTIDTIDLWKEDLPSFDGALIEAKYAVLAKKEHQAEQVRAWQAVEHLVARFVSARTLLFSVPMWNFGVPYRLKHYIDLITQPTLTFSFSPTEGYRGLVAHKRAVIIYSSGGDYAAGSGNSRPDFQKPFFEAWLRFIGITAFETITVAPTIATPEHVARARADALFRAQQLGVQYFEALA